MENVTRTIENALDKGQQDLQGQYQNAKERASAAVRSASDKGTQVWSRAWRSRLRVDLSP
jgi:hypothetical protein